MFALVMSEDRISMQARRHEIMDALRALPGWYNLFLLQNNTNIL